MRCGDCGTDNSTGAEHCSECGKSLVISLGMFDQMDDGPEVSSRIQHGAVMPSYPSEGVCSLCSTQSAADTLQTVRGCKFCAECAPLVAVGDGQTADEEAPRPQPVSVESTGGGGFGYAEHEPPAQSFGSPYSPGPEEASHPGAGFAPTPPFEPPGSFGPSSLDDRVMPSGRPIQPMSSGRNPLPILIALVVIGVGAFLAWKLVLGRDRIDELVAEAESSDRAVRLVPVYEKGVSLRYRGDLTMNIDSAGNFMGKSMGGSAEIVGTADFFLDVLAVDAAGTADLQLALEDVKLDVKGDGLGDVGLPGPLAALDLESLKGQTMTFRVDRRGRPVDVPEGEGLSMFADFVGGVDESWPEREIRPGETWEQSFGGAGGGTGPNPDMKIECRHAGYAKHLGRDCAVIEIEGELDEAEDGVSMSADLHGVIFVDATNGQMVHLAMDASLDMSVSAMGADLTIECEMSMDLKLQ